MNLYIVQAYSGFENKVADTIKDIMSKNSLEGNLGEILVPTQKVIEVKKGKRTQKQKKYFPGYVLVKLDLDKNIYHKIKKIMGQIDETEENPSAGITFEVGEKVKVCDGPFASFTGLIEEIDEDKLRLKVSVSIFGRPTPVDLEFNQVEKS